LPSLSIILAIIGLGLSITIPLLSYIFKKRREVRNYYSVVWRKSSKLRHKDILGERPYNQYYFERSEDRRLKNLVEGKNNVLIVGPPLMGKSRLVFEQLKKLRKSVDVLVPRPVNMPNLVFPSHFRVWRDRLIFIDDLQFFVEKQDNYHLIFNHAKENGISIITTCHSGQQFRKVKNKMIEQGIDIDNLFRDNIIELPRVNPEIGKSIAEKLGMKWDNVKFNGTIGSIFMRLSEMERRFDKCSNIEKTILLSIRKMYITGLYSNNNVFDLDLLKIACTSHELEGKEFEWTGWLKSLEGMEFIKIVRRNKIWAEDAYLEYIVKPEIQTTDVEVFGEMVEIYSGVPDALMTIAERAYDIGNVDLNVADYMQCVIKSGEHVLKNNIPPEVEFKAYRNMGIAHWKLSKVEDVVENNFKALECYRNALKLIEKGSSRHEYSNIMNMMGNSLSDIAIIQEKEKNLTEAIIRYKESLEFFTAEAYPIKYSIVCNNIGGVYTILAQVKEPLQNTKLAIEWLKNALRLRSREEAPKEYGSTQNNLGNAFVFLSDYENKIENIKLAIECYSNFLKVNPKEKRALTYSLALTSLGSTYCMLAELEEPELNAQKAFDALNKALEVRTPERFPLQYSSVQYEIGLTHLFLAKLHNSNEECINAIDAFEDALKYRSFEKFPEHFALIHLGLGNAYARLAESEDKSENYRKALISYDNALRFFTEETHPLIYSEIQDKISQAKKIFFH